VPGQLIIFDIFGKNIIEQELNTKKTEIDLRSERAGIYFLQLIYHGQLTTMKMMMNK
jgi:hypothetical protein